MFSPCSHNQGAPVERLDDTATVVVVVAAGSVDHRCVDTRTLFDL